MPYQMKKPSKWSHGVPAEDCAGETLEDAPALHSGQSRVCGSFEKDEGVRGADCPRLSKRHTLIVGSSDTDRSGFLAELLKQAAPGIPVYGYHSVKEPPDESGNAPIYLYPVPGERVQSQENLLGWCRNRQATTRPEVFDRFARLLENAPGHGVILMDELGPMETRSPGFCGAVMKCLDGDTPVLAAVRDLDTDFLNAVRAHPKARCFFLEPGNPAAVFQTALDFFRKQI
jgi:hypothetical protein